MRPKFHDGTRKKKRKKKLEREVDLPLQPLKFTTFFTASRRTRTPSTKYRFRPESRAGDLSCASRCASPYRILDNPCSCWCPSLFYDPLFLRFSRRLPWFVSPDLDCAAIRSSFARMIDMECTTNPKSDGKPGNPLRKACAAAPRVFRRISFYSKAVPVVLARVDPYRPRLLPSYVCPSASD